MSLGLSGVILHPTVTYHVCEPGYWTYGAKFAFFSQGALTRYGLATA